MFLAHPTHIYYFVNTAVTDQKKNLRKWGFIPQPARGERERTRRRKRKKEEKKRRKEEKKNNKNLCEVLLLVGDDVAGKECDSGARDGGGGVVWGVGYWLLKYSVGLKLIGMNLLVF